MTKIQPKNISKDEIVNLNDIETNLKKSFFTKIKQLVLFLMLLNYQELD